MRLVTQLRENLRREPGKRSSQRSYAGVEGRDVITSYYHVPGECLFAQPDQSGNFITYRDERSSEQNTNT